MNYKFPLSNRILLEARAYALESLEYTTTYEGWDAEKAIDRITRGTMAQLWLGEFCRLNGVNYQSDNSSPYVPDKSDLKIYGRTFDCKQSTIESMWPQVSVNADNNPVFAYAFFYMPRNLDYIHPLGVISTTKFKNANRFVAQGEVIPDTNLIQRFKQGSYFISPEQLTPLSDVLNTLKTQCELEAA